MEKLSLEEIFVLLPKLMIYKDNRNFIEKMKNKKLILSTKQILKILDLNPAKRKNYMLIEKWSSPQYLFLKKIRDRPPYKYTIEDKNFWNFVYKRYRISMQFFNYIRTKATIIED